jgi:hypothetical protein
MSGAPLPHTYQASIGQEEVSPTTTSDFKFEKVSIFKDRDEIFSKLAHGRVPIPRQAVIP